MYPNCGHPKTPGPFNGDAKADYCRCRRYHRRWQVCLGYDIDEDVDTETNDRLLYSLSRVAARLQVSELGYHRNVCFRIEGRESSRRDAADV